MFVFYLLLVGFTTLDLGSSFVIENGGGPKSTEFQKFNPTLAEDAAEEGPTKVRVGRDVGAKSNSSSKKDDQGDKTSQRIGHSEPTGSPQKSSGTPLKKFPSLQYIAYEAKRIVDHGLVKERKKREEIYRNMGVDLKTLEEQMHRKSYEMYKKMFENEQTGRFKRFVNYVSEAISKWVTPD